MNIKRILTSVIGIPLIIILIAFGNTMLIDIFFAIVAIIGIKEYFDAFDKTGNARPIKWIGYLIAASIGVLRLFHTESSLTGASQDMMLIMFGLIVFALFVVFFHILNSGMKRTVEDGAITMFGIIYVPVLTMFLPMIYGTRLGKFVIGYVLICGWATDIFAYLAGKFFGEKKHRFSRISPNKSKEGCIAGTIRSSSDSSNLYHNM